MSWILLAADPAKLGMGWGIAAGGIIVGIALVCFPWKRKSPSPDDK